MHKHHGALRKHEYALQRGRGRTRNPTLGTVPAQVWKLAPKSTFWEERSESSLKNKFITTSLYSGVLYGYSYQS